MAEGRKIESPVEETYVPNPLPGDIFVFRHIYDEVDGQTAYDPLLLFVYLVCTVVCVEMTNFTSGSFAALYAMLSLLCVYSAYNSKITNVDTASNVEVRASTTCIQHEHDNRPLPDRSQKLVAGSLYRLEYYVLINGIVRSSDELYERHPIVYDSLLSKGLIQDQLPNGDLISSSLYNELISRKTLNTQAPALSTLASRCDYIDQSPLYLLTEGTSVSRSTVKLTSLQIGSCHVPVFQTRVASELICTDTEYTINALRLSTQPSRTRSRSDESPEHSQNERRWALGFLSILSIIACILLTLLVASICYQAVQNGSHSDPRPASDGSDAPYDDLPHYSSESCKSVSSLLPSTQLLTPALKNGLTVPDTVKTGNLSSTKLIMDLQPNRLRNQKKKKQVPQDEVKPELVGLFPGKDDLATMPVRKLIALMELYHLYTSPKLQDPDLDAEAYSRQVQNAVTELWHGD